jgi:hypothetical protein
MAYAGTTLVRVLALCLFGTAAFPACGASDHASAGSAGSGGTASTRTPGTGGGTGGVPDGGAMGGLGGGNDGGLFLDGATLVDAADCTQLNIGILGNPGQNPSANFQAWLVSSGTSVARTQTTPGVTLTAAALAPFDVIVLDWLTRDYTADEAAVLATWVKAGGGVASMSGYDNNTTDDWHANSLLAPLQVAYNGSLLTGAVTTFAPHPITAGLTSVTFNGGYAVADLGGSASTRTPIAFFSGNVPIGYAIQMGAGRAFVWGDEWIEFDSEWSTLPDIKQLWVQVFAWLAPANKCALHPPT